MIYLQTERRFLKGEKPRAIKDYTTAIFSPHHTEGDSLDRPPIVKLLIDNNEEGVHWLGRLPIIFENNDKGAKFIVYNTTGRLNPEKVKQKFMKIMGDL